ncbi:MAG: hydantoinase/oxoprolinase N-terminal domain-containing protein [Gammaproteobacteria bacterium]
MSQNPAPFLLGVDTGGTFTDFVLRTAAGLKVHKVLSTPAAPEQAILLRSPNWVCRMRWPPARCGSSTAAP